MPGSLSTHIHTHTNMHTGKHTLSLYLSDVLLEVWMLSCIIWPVANHPSIVNGINVRVIVPPRETCGVDKATGDPLQPTTHTHTHTHTHASIQPENWISSSYRLDFNAFSRSSWGFTVQWRRITLPLSQWIIQCPASRTFVLEKKAI